MYLRIKIETKNGIIVVRLFGELDHHTAGEVKRKTEEFIKEKGLLNIIFDLSKLDFMDSSGIGLIIGRHKLVLPLGGRVCVVTGSKSIERIIKMSGICRLVAVFNSDEEAIKMILGGINNEN